MHLSIFSFNRSFYSSYLQGQTDIISLKLQQIARSAIPTRVATCKIKVSLNSICISFDVRSTRFPCQMNPRLYQQKTNLIVLGKALYYNQRSVFFCRNGKIKKLISTTTVTKRRTNTDHLTTTDIRYW